MKVVPDMKATVSEFDERQATARIAELQDQVQSLQRQLLQAQKMSSIGALASSITHEFNNILMTVINYAKMGVRHKDAATRDKAFEKILAAGHRASKITTGMLSYARQQSDRREAMDLVPLVEDVLVLVEKDLQRYRIRLVTQLDQHPFSAVNSGQVQQVVLNLIVNARQAMEQGGTLKVAVRQNAELSQAEISIQDSGCGIAPEKLRRIFEPFFTTKTADEQGQGGTGLGLSLAKDVMEAHGGRIRVESAVGNGTTFTLKFPLVPSPLKPIIAAANYSARGQD
jgi:signal transduction histidine kinase